MKKNLVLASILAVSLLATGCSQAGKASDVTPITLTEREKQIAALVGEYPFVVDVNYPKDVKGTVLSYEVWKNGSMVENNVVMFGGSADESNKESFTMIYDISDDWKNCTLNLSYEVWKNGSMVENNVVMFGGSADESNKESFTMIYDISDDWKNCTLNLSSTSTRTKFDISLLNKDEKAPNAVMPSFGAEDVGEEYNVKLVPGAY